MFKTIYNFIVTKLQQNRDIRELQALSDVELRDIGVARSEIHNIVLGERDEAEVEEHIKQRYAVDGPMGAYWYTRWW